MSFFTQVIVKVVLPRVEDTFWYRDRNIVTILFNLTTDFLGRIFHFRDNLLTVDTNSVDLVTRSNSKFTLDVFLNESGTYRFQYTRWEFFDVVLLINIEGNVLTIDGFVWRSHAFQCFVEDFLKGTIISDVEVIAVTIFVDIVVLVLIISKDLNVFPETYNYSSIWSNNSLKSIPSFFHFLHTTHDILGSFGKSSKVPFFLKDIVTRPTIVQSNLTISITSTIGYTIGNHEEDGLALVSHATFISVILCDSIFDGWNCWSSSCYADVINEAMDGAFIWC